ncbi:hypothetical protein BC940DRAFT_170483 [Gongronella butleri]|nr:hypothetical protein BC940DRAFT_170483 [Gongronella butleri]
MDSVARVVRDPLVSASVKKRRTNQIWRTMIRRACPKFMQTRPRARDPRCRGLASFSTFSPIPFLSLGLFLVPMAPRTLLRSSGKLPLSAIGCGSGSGSSARRSSVSVKFDKLSRRSLRHSLTRLSGRPRPCIEPTACSKGLSAQPSAHTKSKMSSGRSIPVVMTATNVHPSRTITQLLEGSAHKKRTARPLHRAPTLTAVCGLHGRMPLQLSTPSPLARAGLPLGFRLTMAQVMSRVTQHKLLDPQLLLQRRVLLGRLSAKLRVHKRHGAIFGRNLVSKDWWFEEWTRPLPRLALRPRMTPFGAFGCPMQPISNIRATSFLQTRPRIGSSPLAQCSYPAEQASIRHHQRIKEDEKDNLPLVHFLPNKKHHWA